MHSNDGLGGATTMGLGHSATAAQAQAWHEGYNMGRNHAMKARNTRDAGAGSIAWDGFCDYVEDMRTHAAHTYDIAQQGWFHEGYDTGWEAFEADDKVA